MAANTASESASSASAQAKNAVRRPLRRRPSCQAASSTIGTSTTVSSTISRPRPSTPEGVVDAERLDPVVGLGELEAAAVGSNCVASDDADHQGHQRDAERGLLGQRRAAAWGTNAVDERADERDHGSGR